MLVCAGSEILESDSKNLQKKLFVAFSEIASVESSDVARPLSYKTKTTKLQDQDHLFFQDKTTFFKDHQIINPRPQA